MKDFFQLKKNLKKDFSALKAIKIAILGDSSTQFLSQAIRGFGFDSDFDFQILETDFNQIEIQVFDQNSDLYNFNPNVILIFQSSHKLLIKYNKLESNQQIELANNELLKIEKINNAISNQLNSKIIYYNYNEIDDAVFGNFSNKTQNSFLYQLRKLNFQLMDFANCNSNFFICDLSTIQNLVGKSVFFQPSIYIATDMVLSLETLPSIASKTTNLISSFYGKFKKCLILDLDNTIWGGIIGDDGIENIQIGNLGIGKAFSEFQYWIKKLKNRGIIIAVCSKNEEGIAKEPFLKHPEMLLRLDDVSVFIANWNNKADNIKEIQSILNIGFDSMVFLDDNPFERQIVRENIPEIFVPELPDDPANYLEYLYTLNLFETVTFLNEDKERTKLYQVESQRIKLKKSFINELDFLKSLNMISIVETFNKFNSPRVAQLSQRSNQFNLRTERLTEIDIQNKLKSEDYFTFAFNLDDKFGQNGLISVVVLKIYSNETLFIESWFMSCRVLKRGMEDFIINTLADFARENGFKNLLGEYIATLKNQIVKNLYQNLGFTNYNKNYWILNVLEYQNKKTFIAINNQTV